MPSSTTRAVLLAITLMGCGEASLEAPRAQAASAADDLPGSPAATPADAPLPAPVAVPAAPRTLLLDGLLNSGFELLADGTTTPPKYGAYWVGACAATEGDPESLVTAPGDAFRDEHCLHLPAGSEVEQKIVAAPGSTASVRVSVALRGAGAQLVLMLEDGNGQCAGVRLVNDGPIVRPVARAEGSLLTAEDLALLAPQQAQGSAARAAGNAGGWRRASFELGALLSRTLRRAPQPRLVLHLAAIGPEGAAVDVDEVTAEVRWPLPDEAELAVYCAGLLRESLSLWFETTDQGGLGLADPQSGYVTHGTYDVETGALGTEDTTAGVHAIHTLLVDWLREARRRGWQSDVQRWTPVLQRCVRTLLEHNFDPETGLPRLVSLPDLNPQDDTAVALGPWVEFLLDAREQVADEALAAQCLSQARRIADTLLALQREHDLSPTEAPPGTWSDEGGRIEGNASNWFGFIPDRLTPKGAIETDRRFETSWAILTGRSAWHGMLRSPRAIARVHAVDGHPQDLPGLTRALAGYHRDGAATRYDLETGTDDHYADLAEDALDIARHLGGEGADALTLVQDATDRLLARDAASAGDTLWIQAARLGTACAGDSQRAFAGPLGLYEMTPEASPQSGSSLYHDALLELARNDLQGRQLTSGRFTESSFRAWEIVCPSFKGTCEGDRPGHAAVWWDGDASRTFGGPPASAIDAQHAALRVASAGERLALLAALGLIRDVTDAGLRRPFGWVSGLDDEIARQYQLPDRDLTRLSRDSGAGLGYVAAWMRLLPCLSSEPAPALPVLEVVDGGAALRVSGPPGTTIVLAQAASLFPTRFAEGEARLLPLEAVDGTEGTWPSKVPLDAQGAGKVARRGQPGVRGWVAPLLPGPAGEIVLAGAAIHF